MSASEAEEALALALRALRQDFSHFPPPEREHPVQGEPWRIDFAWPSRGLAVEVDGGRWMPGGGRHAGDKDYEKRRHISRTGWCLLPFTTAEVNRDPLGVAEEIFAAWTERFGTP